MGNEAPESRSLRVALDLPSDLYDTKEIVFGAVSDVKRRTFCLFPWDRLACCLFSC